MSIITKKTCKNGNTYYYYANGKIKTVNKDGLVKWKTKKIFKKN
ncbi:MAG: hypothetical protein QFY14_02610 [Candidatus Phytoplasma pruni]|nr:hypothetical protein [Candidatus Phytoplasma pruni]MDW3617961.1 hypothetical protein [Candidatus Phytoplasma pruni]